MTTNLQTLQERLYNSKVEENKHHLVETLISRKLNMNPEDVDYAAIYITEVQETNPNFKAGQYIKQLKEEYPELIW